MRSTRAWVSRLGLVTVTVLAGVGLAAPAHAATWVQQIPSYAHPEQCLIAGRAGVASGAWLDFRCITVVPDTIGPGVYYLNVELP